MRAGGAEFLDAAAVVGTPKQAAGVHLTPEPPKALGAAVAAKDKELFHN